MELEVEAFNHTEKSTELKSQELDDSGNFKLDNVKKPEDCVDLSGNNRINLNNLTPMYPESEGRNVNTEDTDGNLHFKEEEEKLKDELKLKNNAKIVEETLQNDESPETYKNDILHQKNVELPEGWVRCGKGLRMEFPNTPKNESEKNLETKNLFINFTDGGGVIKSERSLQNALMSLDRKAVRELKGSYVAIKASKTVADKSFNQSTKLNSTPNNHFSEGPNKVEFNKCNYVCPSRMNAINRRSNTASKVNTANLVNLQTPMRNNTYSTGLTELEMLRAQHKTQLEQTKQTLLTHFKDLVEKYRELAVDAINAARNEQKKCQEECKQAYSTAYNACIKYEKDLKNTIRFALKEYQNSNKQSYESVQYDKNEYLKKYEHANKNRNETILNSHKSLRQDLSHDYQIDEKILINFEPKVIDRFNAVLNQLSLYLEDNYNLSHKDSLEFVKSVISNNL